MPNKRILLIDDEPDTVAAIGQLLRARGYSVVTAANGTDGLKQADEAPPDLVIVDLMLPDVDGWRICQRLRMSDTCSGVPILVLSAWIQGTDPREATNLGDVYLDKHTDLNKIVDTVRKLLKDA